MDWIRKVKPVRGARGECEGRVADGRWKMASASGEKMLNC